MLSKTISFIFILSLCVSSTFAKHKHHKHHKRHHKNQNDKKTSVPNKRYEKKTYQALEILSQAIAKIESKSFRRNVNPKKLAQEALKQAVPMIVDAHSSFFPPKSYKSIKESTSGKFSGIGVSITGKTPADEVLVIIDVIPSGPAEKAGLKSGDKIIEANGKKLKGLSTDEVINNLLKGKVGTEVALKIIRDKKPMEFKVKRDIIKEQTSLCYHFKDQNVYYLSLKMFTQTAARQMADLLKKANEKACSGIVLDLRRNPGGILDSAVDMAGLFVDKNSLVVTTKNRNGKIIAEYKTKTDPILRSDTPMFVLIDNFTASASEILAETLRHYSSQASDKDGKNKNKLMAFLVGSSTFGKGSVQEVIPLSSGCALKITTMLYYTPNGTSPQAVGVKPDFKVAYKVSPKKEIKFVKELYGKEKSLPNHITEEEVKNPLGAKPKKKDLAKKAEKKEKTWEERKMEALTKDVAIQASVNMIKMLEIAKKYTPQSIDTRQKAVAFLKKNYLIDNSKNVEKMT